VHVTRVVSIQGLLMVAGISLQVGYRRRGTVVTVAIADPGTGPDSVRQTTGSDQIQ
jgi:hypothetical protein